jgi:hypothetical protein
MIMTTLTKGRIRIMVWIVVMFAGVAATFTALGMYAVWFKVLTVTLFVALVIIVGFIANHLWRQYSRK